MSDDVNPLSRAEIENWSDTNLPDALEKAQARAEAAEQKVKELEADLGFHCRQPTSSGSACECCQIRFFHGSDEYAGRLREARDEVDALKKRLDSQTGHSVALQLMIEALARGQPPPFSSHAPHMSAVATKAYTCLADALALVEKPEEPR